jgi:hypothetical protein
MNRPYDYYYGGEAEQYTFYRLPKALFTNERYKGLSDGAKILYGLMLDRMGLSIQSGWLDERNRIYIIFSLENVQEYMNCKHEKAVKLLAELDTVKGAGLIERVRRGQGKPALVYVRKFFDASDVQTSENQKSGPTENQQSGLPKIRSQDFRNSDAIKYNINNTDLSYTDSIPPSIAENDRTDGLTEYKNAETALKNQIEYDILIQRRGRERVDGAVALITDVLAGKRRTIRIGGADFAAGVVRSRFLKLRCEHLEYVFDQMDKTASKIHNIRSYLLTAFYNAPATLESYEQALFAEGGDTG